MKADAYQVDTGPIVGRMERGDTRRTEPCQGAPKLRERSHLDSGRGMNPRNLKIESAGDFWRGGIKPQIRLVGRWLERAGFKPGHRVEIRSDQPGTLTLCFVEQRQETAG